jgi:hypothetical protein
MSEVPIRIGSVGRKTCNRGIFLVLPVSATETSYFRQPK